MSGIEFSGPGLGLRELDTTHFERPMAACAVLPVCNFIAHTVECSGDPGWFTHAACANPPTNCRKLRPQGTDAHVNSDAPR